MVFKYPDLAPQMLAKQAERNGGGTLLQLVLEPSLSRKEREKPRRAMEFHWAQGCFARVTASSPG